MVEPIEEILTNIDVDRSWKLCHMIKANHHIYRKYRADIVKYCSRWFWMPDGMVNPCITPIMVLLSITQKELGLGLGLGLKS